MKRESCSAIGRLSRTHGNKGVVQLNLKADTEKSIQSEQFIFIQINERDQLLVPFFVVSSERKGNASFLLKLKFIDSEADAASILNKEVFIALQEESNSDSKDFDIFALKNYQVIDEVHGTIGELKSVDEYPSQIILTIANKSSSEILIPLTDQTIVHIDTDQQILTVNTPAGLVDLYTSKDE